MSQRISKYQRFKMMNPIIQLFKFIYLSIKIMFVVAKVNIDYKKAARFNDELDIETSLDKIGASKVDLTQNIMKNSELYTSAKVSIACIHSETFKPQRIPKLIKQQMEIL